MSSLNHRPSVHVGASLDSLITKALESEATDLLPTIKSAVEAMLHPAPSPDAMLDTPTATPSIDTSDTAEVGSSHTSSAASLELPIHLLEFSSALPAVKKEPLSFTRGKPRTRHLMTGDKKENGGKKVDPHTKEEKHRESKTKQAVDKETKGESLLSNVKPSEKIMVHSEPGSSSHKEESEPNVSSVEIDDLETSKNTSSEAKDSTKKKSRQFQKEGILMGKRMSLVISRRQVHKRRVVLSSSEDEKDDVEEKGQASPSDCESESHPPAELAEKKNKFQGAGKRRKRSNSDKGTESTSHDVIVTRSNRRVKPSRRYALSNQYQYEDKIENEEIVNVEQEKIAVEVEDKECPPEQEQSPKRKKQEQEEPVAKRLRRHK